MAFDYSKDSLIMEFMAVSKKTPTFEDVKKQFKLADHEVDEDTIIIPMAESAAGKTFLVVVSKEAGERIEKEAAPGFVKNWSNPTVQPFGPM